VNERTTAVLIHISGKRCELKRKPGGIHLFRRNFNAQYVAIFVGNSELGTFVYVSTIPLRIEDH
jgi:hypothetical protein